MYVRLAFSVAVQVDADVLLIDEVLAVGDSSFQQKCFDRFHRLRAEGKTIVFVTHDMSSVTRFCNRAMLMERGRVVCHGDPDRVAREYHELNFGRAPEAAVEGGESGTGTVVRRSSTHGSRMRPGSVPAPSPSGNRFRSAYRSRSTRTCRTRSSDSV